MTTSIIIWSLFLLSAQLTHIGDAAREHTKKLEGKWVVRRFEYEEHDLTDYFKGVSIEFTDKTALVRFTNTQAASDYSLNTSKTPHQIDVVSRASKKTLKGIYTISDDSLTMCLDITGDHSRPSSFKTRMKSFVAIVQLTRSKP